MRKKPEIADTEEPSVPTVPINKSTWKQANSEPALQIGPRASSPSRLHSPGEGAVCSQPDLRRWLPSSRQDVRQRLSVPLDQSSPRSFQGASFVMRLAHCPQWAITSTSVQTYAGVTGEKCGQNPVMSQQHLTPICSVGSFHVRCMTRETKDLHF